MSQAPHSKDIGLAIRDALALLNSVTCFDWAHDEDGLDECGAAEIKDIDASEASNLLIEMADGSLFRVRIVRRA